MNIKPVHPNFKCPTRGTEHSGGYDLYMPEGGHVTARGFEGIKVGLGFAAAVPRGYVALIVPRSGKGVKHGLALNNTVGVIDADYRGEWMVSMRVHDVDDFQWQAGDRLFQFLVVPIGLPELQVTDDLDATDRGENGFGSTG